MTAQRRIISVQGPFNLLSVLSHLFAEQEEVVQKSDDILVVHGLHAGDDTKNIHAVISDMARVWSWEKIVFLADFEKEHLHNTQTIDQSLIDKLHAAIGVSTVDEVFIVRNWQLTNELILKAFPSANKILYGDAFGQIDSYAGPRYESINEGRFLLPLKYFPHSTEEKVIDPKFFPFQISPRHCVLKVIEKYLATSDEARAVHAEIGADSERKIILLTKNATESKVTQLETEIAIYVDAVLKVAQPGVEVVIKPHPREALGQSGLVQRALKDLCGIECKIVGAGSYTGHMPVEVLCFRNNFLAVIAPLVSVTCRQLKFLFDIDSYDPLSDEMLGFINPARAYHYLATDLVNREAVSRLNTWDESGMVYEWFADGVEEKKQLARLKSVASRWPQLRDAGDPQVSQAFEELNKASQEGAVEKLIDAARRLVELAPQDLPLLFSLGEFGEKSGDLETAQRAYEIATVMDVRNIEAHKRLSAVLLKMGREGEAKIAELCARQIA